LTQGVVSRAEDQDYGNLTFNTIGRIAAGLDMAFIGRFVPFSDLVKFAEELSESEFKGVPTFAEEKTVRSTSRHHGFHRRNRDRRLLRARKGRQSRKMLPLQFPVRNQLAGASKRGPGKVLEAFGDSARNGAAMHQAAI
jgi:hypothetical protein